MMLRSQFTIAQKGLLLLAFVVGSQLLMLVITSSINRVRESERSGEQITAATNAAAHRLLASLVDSETAIRGYALTQRESFLAPHVDAKRSVPVEIARLEALTRNTTHAAAVSRLRARAEELLRYQEEQRHLIGSGNVAQAIARVRREEGKVLMDAIRRSVHDLTRDLEVVNSRRQRRLDERGRF